MKKIVLAVLLCGSIGMLQAQTEKGDWLIGGRFDVATGDNSTLLGFTPNAGIFVINNLAIGGNIGITYEKAGDTKVTDLNIGPFVRYYFSNGKIRPLLIGSIDYLSTRYKAFDESETFNGSRLFLGGGPAIFINNNISLEILAGYVRTKYEDFDGDGGFKLGIGFQVYLSKRQVDKMRGK